MKTLRFKNGDEMPALGLGTWQAGPNEVKMALKEAVGNGYRHIDCAAVYGNEAEIGEALRELFDEGVVRREDLWITSKLWNDSHDPKEVLPALEKTLHDLQIDYLDLYLMHWPVAQAHGVRFPKSAEDMIGTDRLPLADTWREMNRLVESGRVKHAGVSNFSIAKIKHLIEETGVTPEMNQVEIHPHFQQSGLVEFCQGIGVHVTAYAPIGGSRPATPKSPKVLDDAIITMIAADHEYTPAQVALAWGVMRGYSVIPKSVNPQRLRANLAAADIILTVEEMSQIAAAETGVRSVTGDIFTMEGSPYTQENLWDEEPK